MRIIACINKRRDLIVFLVILTNALLIKVRDAWAQLYL